MEATEQFLQWVEESGNIVFFGGAGVSTESGIPDFRSVDGLYNQQYKYPPELSLSGSMISISFFSDAPFINALIAVSVFPFLALPLMITIFMRVSSKFRFLFSFP